MGALKQAGKEGGAAMVVLLVMMVISSSLKSCVHVPPSDIAGGVHNEVEQTRRLAAKYSAKTEVMLEDRTRCDLVNNEYAIEVEYPKKWAESIGQSLYYALQLHRKPAVLYLISDAEKEQRYLRRANLVAAQYGIQVYQEPVQ